MAAFAAERASDGALTVMVISKALSGTTSTTVNLANFAPGTSAQVWQLKAGTRITRLANVSVSQNRLVVPLPPQSVTLFVVARASGSTTSTSSTTSTTTTTTSSSSTLPPTTSSTTTSTSTSSSRPPTTSSTTTTTSTSSSLPTTTSSTTTTTSSTVAPTVAAPTNLSA